MVTSEAPTLSVAVCPAWMTGFDGCVSIDGGAQTEMVTALLFAVPHVPLTRAQNVVVLYVVQT